MPMEDRADILLWGYLRGPRPNGISIVYLETSGEPRSITRMIHIFYPHLLRSRQIVQLLPSAAHFHESTIHAH